MSETKDGTEALLEVLDEMRQSLQLWMPGRPGLRFFMALQSFARRGLELEVILQKSWLDKLEAEAFYFEELQRLGGQVYVHSSTIRTSKRYFAIIDGEQVVEASLLQAGGCDLHTAPPAVAAFQRQYYRLRSQCAPVLQLTGAGAQPEPAIRFSAEAETVEPGRHFQLEWDVSGAERATIEPAVGRVGPMGIKAVSIRSTTEFVLSAEYQGVWRSKVIVVQVSDAPRIEYQLSTEDPQSGEAILLHCRKDLPDHYGIIHGQSVRLSWRSYNVQRLELAGFGTVPLQGQRVLAPNRLSAYTFTAHGPGGTAERTLVINVFPLPQITQIQQPALPEIAINTSITLPEAPDALPAEAATLQPPLPSLEELKQQLRREKAALEGEDPGSGIWHRFRQWLSRKT